MAVRVPGIIRETVERNADYPASVKDAFERLAGELEGDAPLRLFTPPAPDFDLWTPRFALHAGETWLDSEWFFCEMLVYRLMMEAGRYWATLRDPFAPFKREELASDALWEALAAVLDAPGTLEERLATGLRSLLWGNRIDLSLKQTAALGTSARDEHLLADDVPLVVRHVLGSEPGALHVIMDNAGTEQALDFAFVDLLLAEDLAATVTLHVKMQPVLVSDVIVADIYTMLDAMTQRGGEAAKLSARLKVHLGTGRLAVVPDFFWNTAGRLWELPPRLSMKTAPLVIAKGDINYRRATNDALWPPGVPLSEAVCGFPAPLLVLRTLKSDTLVGIDAETQKRLDAIESDWRTSGAYGVAQFASE
jgi:hypothetical protein